MEVEARNARLDEAIDVADFASQVPFPARKMTDSYLAPGVST